MAHVSQSAHIELRQLRYAITAADCGSFRQASELLAVRHSVLSRSISQLEHLIGATLFERSSGGVAPTFAGRRVLRISRMVLEQVGGLAAIARSSGRGEAGRLSIGFCTSIAAGNLRATIVEFKSSAPDIEIATVERSRILLMNALRNGTIDIAIVPRQKPLSDGVMLPVWSERVLVLLPQDHPLAAREIIYWTDLRNQTVLLSEHDPDGELEDLLVSKLLTDEHRPKVARHDVSRAVIKSLISIGLGVSLSIESDVDASFASLIYREIQDGAGSSRISFHAHWREGNVNPALQQFLELLSGRYASAPLGEGRRPRLT
ncbi:LysR family transcriptional regulator [Bradyrhizobium sp. 44]|uniref:LysR family transcriptional regulator n=1 Tax=unclassified Bradyrhizobium TaxID=2631580 RepID=UPI001FF7E647|nr:MULTISPECIES: LysR family transcriptional regulator [unclassified Bradyrhizobium]MCK1289002.1 LysR family transcriptional regulator [Bradyrhizobium sp. 44]UPJ44034.1 LysR family transcriptional regulator [Bradyrhizobium sp. 40]